MSRLDAATWPEIEHDGHRDGVLLIPLGSTEQHGPHLPVTTDTDIALALCLGVERRLDGVVIAPALAYGSSGEHQDFAGTVSIGQEATELVVLELGRSAARHFATVVLISTHGGNRDPVHRASNRLREEGHPVHVWTPNWHGDLHAGRTETSLMLAIAPHRVRGDRAEAGDTRPLTTLLPLLRSGGVRAVSPNGVLGDPVPASEDEGRRLLADAVSDLADTVERVRGAESVATAEEAQP